MNDLNQKIKEFARKSYELDALADYGEWKPNDLSEMLLKDMHGVFVEFAKLVAEDCAMIAYKTGDDGDCYANSILFEYNVDNCRNEK